MNIQLIEKLLNGSKTKVPEKYIKSLLNEHKKLKEENSKLREEIDKLKEDKFSLKQRATQNLRKADEWQARCDEMKQRAEKAEAEHKSDIEHIATCIGAGATLDELCSIIENLNSFEELSKELDRG